MIAIIVLIHRCMLMKSFKQFISEGTTWRSVSSELSKYNAYKDGNLRSPRTDGTYGVFYYHKPSGLFGRVLNADDKGFYYYIKSGEYYLPYAADLVSSGDLFIFKTRNNPKSAQKFISDKLGFDNHSENFTNKLKGSIQD